MKKCFKCQIEKSISEFYKHSRMFDGHLNKCKECTKKDAHQTYQTNTKDFEKVEKERTRGRNKYHRLYVGLSKSNPERNKRYAMKYPEKELAKDACQKIKTIGEKHHWSYNANHFLDFIELSKKHHMKSHRFIVYDQERKMYRRVDNNELLETKERHETYIRYCIDNKPD